MWGEGKDNNLYKGNLRVKTDKDGNFLGIFQKNKAGKEFLMSPKAYNNRFTEQKVWDQQTGRKDYEKK